MHTYNNSLYSTWYAYDEVDSDDADISAIEDCQQSIAITGDYQVRVCVCACVCLRRLHLSHIIFSLFLP